MSQHFKRNVRRRKSTRLDSYQATQLQVLERRSRGATRRAAASRRKPSRSFPIVRFATALVRFVAFAGSILALLYGLFFLITSAPKFFSSSEHTIPIAGPSPQLDFDTLQWEAHYEVLHTVAGGDALSGIFSAYGLSLEDAQAVFSSLKSQNLHKIKKGQVLAIAFTKEGNFDSLSTQVDSLRRVVVRRAEDGSFSLELDERTPGSQERVVNGKIQSSFALAAKKRGLPYAAIDDLVDLFGDRISFHRDFRRNDEFSIVYKDSILDDGTSLGFGTILAAALEVGGEIFCAVRYVGADGKARYFDQNGELLGAAFLRYPVKFSRISSSFNTNRFHPVLKRRRPHNGTDFAAPIGTPVRSVADGRVIFAARKGGNGNMVKIRHTNRYTTAYLHLHRIAKGLRNGSRVIRGQVIGTVGMTGLATGPHLHYSFYDNGRYVDPLKVKLPKIESLTKDQKIDPVYLKRVLYTLEHYRGRKIDAAEVEPIQ